MLTYTMITLSNPKKPELATVNIKALVISDDVSLVIPAPLMQLLQLEISGIRMVHVQASAPQSVPYAGPLKIEQAGHVAYTGAVVSGTEVVIGAPLVRELAMTVAADVPPAMMSAKPVMALPAASPESVAPAAKTHKIMMVEHFIDDDTCRMICDYADKQTPQRLGVVDHEKTDGTKVASKIDTKSRDTFNVPIDGIEAILREIFFNLYSKHVEPFFGVEIDFWEKPQLLRYPPGGKYGAHADADQWIPNQGGKPGGTWKRNHDRDVSVLLYLNDNFTGGLLDFPNHKLKVQPKPGLLAAFPSHGEYLHGAEPTGTGIRYVLVSWSAAKGTQRVRDVPYASIYMSEFRK